jgi:hypothetical protein
MLTRTIFVTSMLALATMSGQAFAYSNVSPKEALQKAAIARQPLNSFSAFDQAIASWTVEPDNHRYHGGPKSSQ